MPGQSWGYAYAFAGGWSHLLSAWPSGGPAGCLYLFFDAFWAGRQGETPTVVGLYSDAHWEHTASDPFHNGTQIITFLWLFVKFRPF